MGHAVVYCSQCRERIPSDDFQRGQALTVQNRSYCARCREAGLKAQTEAEAAAEPVPVPVPAPVAARKRGGGSDRVRARRSPRPAGAPAGTPWIPLAAGGAVVILGIAFFAFGSRSRPERAPAPRAADSADRGSATPPMVAQTAAPAREDADARRREAGRTPATASATSSAPAPRSAPVPSSAPDRAETPERRSLLHDVEMLAETLPSRPAQLAANREAIQALRARAQAAAPDLVARLDALERDAAQAHEAFATRQWEMFRDGIESSLNVDDVDVAHKAFEHVPPLVLERHREEVEALRRRVEQAAAGKASGEGERRE